MLKRNACRLATVLFALLALLSRCGPEGTGGPQWAKPAGMILGLLSAIFATQWVHYQKRLDETVSRSRWPAWVRRLLY